jgi:hypothetical protein
MRFQAGRLAIPRADDQVPAGTAPSRCAAVVSVCQAGQLLTSVCSSRTALSGASMSISWWPRTGAPASIPVGLPPRPARDQRVKLPRGVISSTASRPRPDRSRPWINHPPASRSSRVPSPQPTALWSTAHAPRSLRDDLGDVRLTDTSVKIVSPSSKVAYAPQRKPRLFDRVPDLAEQAVRTRIDLSQGGRVVGPDPTALHSAASVSWCRRDECRPACSRSRGVCC